jgi:hypothetical protein
MSTSLYLASRIGEALGLGLLGTIVPILLRRRFIPSIVGGALGVATIPALAVFGGYTRGSDLDGAIVLALALGWGVVIGAAIHFSCRLLQRATTQQ